MTRSTLLRKNHPTLLLIKKRTSIEATGGLLSKNVAIFTRKHVLKSLLNKVAEWVLNKIENSETSKVFFFSS